MSTGEFDKEYALSLSESTSQLTISLPPVIMGYQDYAESSSDDLSVMTHCSHDNSKLSTTVKMTLSGTYIIYGCF